MSSKKAPEPPHDIPTMRFMTAMHAHDYAGGALFELLMRNIPKSVQDQPEFQKEYDNAKRRLMTAHYELVRAIAGIHRDEPKEGHDA